MGRKPIPASLRREKVQDFRLVTLISPATKEAIDSLWEAHGYDSAASMIREAIDEKIEQLKLRPARPAASDTSRADK